MNRYLLLAGEQIENRSDVLDRISRVTGLALSFSNSRIAALAHPSCGLVKIGAAGCILGRLFHRHGPAEPVACLTATAAEALAGSGGQSLLTQYWGAYVAVVGDGGGVRILRDPSGDFPCYFVRDGEPAVFASDAELLVKCGFARPTVDCAEIGRQLFRAFVPVPTTALGGIRELLAGFALHVGPGDATQQQCWNPWDHVAARDEDRDVAARRLARTIHHSVQAIAAHRGRLLLSVSGGLDSSIVGSCLARAGADAVCLTMFTGDPAGDERPFARALCDQAGLSLIEREYRLDDIDLDEVMAPNLPRPRDRIHALAFERVHYAVAAEIGARAFMTGNGGDHVFGYSQSAAPVADLYLSEGLTAATLGSLRDVCRQTGCNLADAVAQAWRLAHGPPSRPVRPNPLFLHPEFVAELGPRDLHHPWLEAPPGALPGKAAHVATILRVQPNLEPSLVACSKL
ncbi:MAG: asparagine synthase-related protein [Sphingomicrobium sp.]